MICLKTVSFPFLLVLQLSKFSYPSWLLSLSRFLSLFLLFLPFSISLPPSITHVTYLLWAPDGDEGVEGTLRHRRNPIVPRQYRRRRPLRSPQCSPTTPPSIGPCLHVRVISIQWKPLNVLHWKRTNLSWRWSTHVVRPLALLTRGSSHQHWSLSPSTRKNTR